MPFIYLITNKIDGKRYVGKTIKPLEVRWKGHVGCSRRNDTQMLVTRSISKYGVDSFELTLVEECSEDILSEREMFWIKELHTHISEGGYNLTFGGDGGLPGFKHSEESKELMRQRALSRKPMSQEVRDKISSTKSGVPQRLETVLKRALSNTGKKRTEEQRKNISEGQKGKVVTEETRKKISEANKNRPPPSQETRQKLSLANKGKKIHTEEFKKRIAARRRKPVCCYNLEMKLIANYESITEASKLSKTPMISIQRSLAQGKFCNGILWKYLNLLENT